MSGRRPDWLALASIAFVVANVLHTIDHVRTGTGRLSVAVLAGGSLITVAAVVTLALALRRDPRAPLVAAAVGLGSAVGIAASHLAPHWSTLSDSYLDGSFDAFSWIVVSAEIAAGLALGLAGLRRLGGARRLQRA
jgi:multisubunit Na+/H+ antiporter MnhB subunit